MLKVIVMGGGIGELTLARACLDVGIQVEIYEKRSLPEMLSGPGGIFIQRNAMHVYQLLWGGQICEVIWLTLSPFSSTIVLLMLKPRMLNHPGFFLMSTRALKAV